MNKKIGLFFFIITIAVSYTYSQQSSQEAEHDDIFSSDMYERSNADDQENHLDQMARLEDQDNTQENSPRDLTKIATDEANQDLVGLLDTLENGTKKQEMDFGQSPENEQENVSDATIEGIDTVDLEQPQGNWLFKRKWWERSEGRYEKIKQKIEEIFENRMIVFEKRSALVKNVLDPFYLKIGMGQGEFQAILTDRIQSLEKEREKKGALTSQERDMLAMLEGERETLEQLIVDVQAIGEVENRVDESLSLFLDQIKAIRSYDMQAWDAFKEIARVVDDEKARQLYYVVETSWHNIKDIGNYLEHKFAAHFDRLIATAKEQTERVTNAVAALKEKGIDFKKQVDQLIEPKSIEKPADQDQEEELEEEPGFFRSYILNPLSSLWDGIVSVVTWPYYALFGSKEDEEAQEE